MATIYFKNYIMHSIFERKVCMCCIIKAGVGLQSWQLNSIQIMIVYECNDTNIFMRWKIKWSIRQDEAELNNGTFHLSPNENICSIARMRKHSLFVSYKGVFINTLGGGGAGQLKIFVVKLFWPPVRKPPKLSEPPLNKCKNFFDPTIATCIISVSFLYTNLFGMHHRCTSITGNT